MGLDIVDSATLEVREATARTISHYRLHIAIELVIVPTHSTNTRVQLILLRLVAEGLKNYVGIGLNSLNGYQKN